MSGLGEIVSMGKRELVVGEENVIHLPLLLKVFFQGILCLAFPQFFFYFFVKI